MHCCSTCTFQAMISVLCKLSDMNTHLYHVFVPLFTTMACAGFCESIQRVKVLRAAPSRGASAELQLPEQWQALEQEIVAAVAPDSLVQCYSTVAATLPSMLQQCQAACTALQQQQQLLRYECSDTGITAAVDKRNELRAEYVLLLQAFLRECAKFQHSRDDAVCFADLAECLEHKSTELADMLDVLEQHQHDTAAAAKHTVTTSSTTTGATGGSSGTVAGVRESKMLAAISEAPSRCESDISDDVSDDITACTDDVSIDATVVPHCDAAAVAAAAVDAGSDDCLQLCTAAVAAVNSWRARHSSDGVSTSSDAALSALWKALAVYSSSTSSSSSSSSSMCTDSAVQSALAAASTALTQEYLHHVTDNFKCDMPLQELELAATGLQAYCATGSAVSAQLEEATVWAESQLSVQHRALQLQSADRYPPSTAVLAELRAAVRARTRRVKQLQLDISYSGSGSSSSSSDVQALQQELAAQLADVRGLGLSEEIQRERARLFSLADQNFPELLRPGCEWAVTVGVSECTVTCDAGRAGLLAEGRLLDDFVNREMRFRQGE
jgi:hypothetical protein